MSTHIPASAFSNPFPILWGRRVDSESQIRSCHPLLKCFNGFPVLLRIKAKTNNKKLLNSVHRAYTVYQTFLAPSHSAPLLSLTPSFHWLFVLNFLLYHVPSHRRAFAHLPGRLFLCLSTPLASAQPNHLLLTEMVPGIPD